MSKPRCFRLAQFAGSWVYPLRPYKTWMFWMSPHGCVHGVSQGVHPAPGEAPIESCRTSANRTPRHGYLPPGTRFKPTAQAGLSTGSRSYLLPGSLGRRLPVGSRSQAGDTHIPAWCCGFSQRNLSLLSSFQRTFNQRINCRHHYE